MTGADAVGGGGSTVAAAASEVGAAGAEGSQAWVVAGDGSAPQEGL